MRWPERWPAGRPPAASQTRTTGEPRALHPEIEVTLLRVAQEALANVAKHACASRAGVTLSYMEDVVTLDVRDDGAGFGDRAAAPRPDVVLMDLRMPVLDGVSAIRLLAERSVAARVLVLTTFDTDTDVVPAIEAGATGYLLKDSPPEELRRGVRAAARGEAVLSPPVATRLVGQVREPAKGPLSQRELDVLALIARAARTGRPLPGCSSARPRSRPMCCTCTPSSASTTGPPPWPPASSAACYPAPSRPDLLLV